MPYQPSLFPSEQSTPVDTGEAAAHIARNAPRVEHVDRTSEAARDQGWGPVTVEEVAGQTAVSATKPELPLTYIEAKDKLKAGLSGDGSKITKSGNSVGREGAFDKEAKRFWASQR